MSLISRQAAVDAMKSLSDSICEQQAIDALCELPSAQPDLSEYSDKLWQAAYERGKADALDEIVRCKDCNHWSRESILDGFCSEDCMRHDEDFYCGYAERRTDE